MRQVNSVRVKEIQRGELAVVAILLSGMEGELLYLRIILLLSPPSNFVQHALPFSNRLKLFWLGLGYCTAKHTKSGATITHPPCTTVKMAASLIELCSGQRETWFLLLNCLVKSMMVFSWLECKISYREYAICTRKYQTIILRQRLNTQLSCT